MSFAWLSWNTIFKHSCFLINKLIILGNVLININWILKLNVIISVWVGDINCRVLLIDKVWIHLLWYELLLLWMYWANKLLMSLELLMKWIIGLILQLLLIILVVLLFASKRYLRIGHLQSLIQCFIGIVIPLVMRTTYTLFGCLSFDLIGWI